MSEELQKQEKLTNEELHELIQRTLSGRDPNVDLNSVEFNYDTQEFIRIHATVVPVELFELEGNCVNIDTGEVDVGGSSCLEAVQTDSTELADTDDNEASEESSPVEQLSVEAKEASDENNDETTTTAGPDETVVDVSSAEDSKIEEKRDEDKEGGEEEGEGDGDEGKDDESAVKPASATSSQKAKKFSNKRLVSNQFNYSDRGSLTYKIFTRDESTQTAPPPPETVQFQLTQWVIHDEYQKDYAQTMAAKDKEEREKLRHDNSSTELHAFTNDSAIDSNLFHAVKIMERMVTQNTFEDIAYDCQFYDDPADKFRNKEGALLPLWEFNYDECHNMIVTDITWCSKYYDLFAVSFGTYNFQVNKKKGFVCLYTLKNPSHPEFRIKFKTGAQTVDIHGQKPYYIATGLYDGRVAVTNVRDERNLFTLESDLQRKHAGPVWEVRWCDDPRDRQLGLYSAGSDGKIYKWLVDSQELSMIPIITLHYTPECLDGSNEIAVNLPATCNCIAFEPSNYEIFLVGTAEGLVYKCSISYSCSYLFTYKAHDMAVYRISYNSFVKEVFATCSGDWKIKIWEDCKSEPLYIFDLFCSVGDVQWAPYSSTVFAGVTSDGRVHVFDLAVNKMQPICCQVVCCPETVSVSRLRFNNKLPILLVGDSSGNVISLKLSPNCRVPAKASKKNVFIDPKDLEVMKIERVLAFVREPVIQKHVK